VRKLLLPVCAGLAALAVAGPAGSTTNAPAIFTVKVTITDKGISMSPSHAVRGSTCTFILTNRGKKTHTFVIGNAVAGKGQGFTQVLRPNGQYTKVMFLDYRGVMKVFLRTRTIVTARAAFKII
jgi:hypothetical protein